MGTATHVVEGVGSATRRGIRSGPGRCARHFFETFEMEYGLVKSASSGTLAGQIAGDMANVASRFGMASDDLTARERRASIKTVADLSTVRADAFLAKCVTIRLS
jgi:hypothetical protein